MGAGVLAGLALVVSSVAALLIAAAINPGFDPHLYYLKGAAPATVLAMAITFGCTRLLRANNLVAGIAAVAVVSVVTALVFAEGFASQPDMAADLARSHAFLKTFQHPAGSQLIRTETFESYPDGDMFEVGFLNPYKGYTSCRRGSYRPELRVSRRSPSTEASSNAMDGQWRPSPGTAPASVIRINVKWIYWRTPKATT